LNFIFDAFGPLCGYARTICHTIRVTTVTRDASGTPALMASMIIEGPSDLNMTSSVIPKPRSGKLTLKAIADRNFGNLAMIEKLNHRGYYIRATRETAYPSSWRWRIIRRGKPMGVRIEGGGFTTYDAARLAGKLALTNFIEQLELDELIDIRPLNCGSRRKATRRPAARPRGAVDWCGRLWLAA
jgi:hypothetical protein